MATWRWCSRWLRRQPLGPLLVLPRIRQRPLLQSKLRLATALALSPAVMRRLAKWSTSLMPAALPATPQQQLQLQHAQQGEALALVVAEVVAMQGLPCLVCGRQLLQAAARSPRRSHRRFRLGQPVASPPLQRLLLQAALRLHLACPPLVPLSLLRPGPLLLLQGPDDLPLLILLLQLQLQGLPPKPVAALLLLDLHLVTALVGLLQLLLEALQLRWLRQRQLQRAQPSLRHPSALQQSCSWVYRLSKLRPCSCTCLTCALPRMCPRACGRTMRCTR